MLRPIVWREEERAARTTSEWVRTVESIGELPVDGLYWRTDPTRHDTQTWIASYASLHHRPGAPLFDLMAIGKSGRDSRMLFSWYAADYCTDPAFASKSPEERANPSVASWGNPDYLGQQQRRLPAHKYRRLHLNLPGLPEGSAFQPEPIMDAVARGTSIRPAEAGVSYHAFVDMSGGSSDDAVLGVAHRERDGRVVLDALVDQGGRPPFDPNAAVARFVAVLREYRISRVTGDRHAGRTFAAQFEQSGISYAVADRNKSQLYEAFEPVLNSHRAVLLDVPTLEQQLLGLVWRGGRIDHPTITPVRRRRSRLFQRVTIRDPGQHKAAILPFIPRSVTPLCFRRRRVRCD